MNIYLARSITKDYNLRTSNGSTLTSTIPHISLVSVTYKINYCHYRKIVRSFKFVIYLVTSAKKGFKLESMLKYLFIFYFALS